MTLVRLSIVIMALMAGVSVDSYAGCGASKPISNARARSQSADAASEQRNRKERAMRRVVLAIVENLKFYASMSQASFLDFGYVAERRLIEGGKAIIQHNLGGEVFTALMASGMGQEQAAALVKFARRASSSALEAPHSSEDGEGDTAK